MTQTLKYSQSTQPAPPQILVKNDLVDEYERFEDLSIDKNLKRFIDVDVIPGTGLKPDEFWLGFAQLIHDLAPKNKQLLKVRDNMQTRIDQWHEKHAGEKFNAEDYRTFLEGIGYIAPKVGNFSISTDKVDDEIAMQAGPQLVVPLKNARFALNAANARWGSLYDALYGSDIIANEGELASTKVYNPKRGQEVIKRGRQFLDEVVPLDSGSHSQVQCYRVEDTHLHILLEDGSESHLKDEEKFVGFQGDALRPSCLLFCNNALHIELQIDAKSAIGKHDHAGVKDIVLEAALTTIMDCEDSVAAVDAEDKLEVYSNWLGLVKGNLTASFEKVDTDGTRRLHKRNLLRDRLYTRPDGSDLRLHGRSLLFIRNVGHLMTNPAILDAHGEEIPEGIMDGVITSLIAMHDVNGNGFFANSRKKSIYIVKPKMHGPQEVAFTNTLFQRIEHILGLAENTIKLGIMDEERRTTLNLKACIKQAASRVVFINTGFLDRTGDEIHTSMHAGPMIAKTKMKAQPWIQAYEAWNVDVGLDCGLPGRAQIGKGMWPMPDLMADMLANKIVHPEAGANTAWVPSPTAATIHAIHYHKVNVYKQQRMIANRLNRDMVECFRQLLEIPTMADPTQLSLEFIEQEINNNCQGILGYVVRWVDQGIGCSKVPDINDVGLMEDRATLRISSQHLANWLHHGICSKEQVEEALVRMAGVVDKQNATDPNYEAMVPDLAGSIAFKAASDLIFLGVSQPSGYTEPLLHEYRKKKKLQLRQRREY